MRYIIDTNVLANFAEDKYIPNDVLTILDDYENQIYDCMFIFDSKNHRD